MPKKRPATIDEYIRAAPREGQPHLRRLYAILKQVAPQADEAIKWGTPFFVEPRFVFAFAAHKVHCSFAPNLAALEHFSEDLKAVETTKGTLKLPYAQPLPERLIRKLAKHSLKLVSERDDAAFW